MKYKNERYNEAKNDSAKKATQLKFLTQLRSSINFQIKRLPENMSLVGDEKDRKYSELINQLQEAEVSETKLRRNVHNSSAYSFEPFVGLNRAQRRQSRRG